MNIEHFFHNADASKLQELVANGQEENLRLDFKILNNANLKHADDRRNLAKVISGFANSSGGLVVWGIDARSPKNGEPDVAQGFSQIQPLKVALNRLNELTGDATSPIVDGVQHREIPVDSPDRGVVLTLVPESPRGPHMAKLREDRYWKRSGDSFYKMEHFDIEDMFGRRRRPMLELTWRAVRHGITGRKIHHCFVVLELTNRGRGTAIAPFVRLEVEAPFKLDRYQLGEGKSLGIHQLETVGAGAPACFAGATTVAIHPNTSVAFGCIVVDVGQEVVPNQPSIGIVYKCAATSMPLAQQRLEIPGEAILTAMFPEKSASDRDFLRRWTLRQSQSRPG